MEVRILNVLLGIWVFASAFFLHHTPAQEVNALVVGALCALVALVGTRVPSVHWANLFLGAWLFASALVLPRTGQFPMWNNLVAGIAMFFVAGVPSERGGELPRQRTAA